MRAHILGRNLGVRLPDLKQLDGWKSLAASKGTRQNVLSNRRRYQQRYTTEAVAPTAAYDAPPTQQELQRQKVFCHFPVYKQKAAVQVSVISPTWRAVGPGDVAVERQGTFFLEFAEALPSSGSNPGDRRYGWEQKQTFALSAVELSHIIEPDPAAPKSLIHDPNMKGSNRGDTIKTLRIAKQPDGQSWFISLAVKTGGGQQSVGVNFSKEEFCTLQVLAKYAVPHLLGFDAALGTNVNFPASQDSNEVPF